MMKWKIGVTLAAITLIMGSAQGRSYRTAISATPVSCAVVPDYPPYLYPAPNWQPFFRRHLSSYRPVLTCLPIAGAIEPSSQPTISVRY